MYLRICSRTNCRSLSRSFPARHLAPPATRMGSKNSTPMRLVSLWSTTSKRWSKHQTIAASALYLARGESKWNTLRIRHLASGHYIGGGFWPSVKIDQEPARRVAILLLLWREGGIENLTPE